MQNSDRDYAVLMSVYAGEQPDWFRDALRSMFSQTLPPAQFVLVCDGPLTSALEGVIAEAAAALGDALCLVRLAKNGGLGPALNVGLTHCAFETVARMDTDDIALPGRCETQLALMRAQSLDLVSAAVEEFDPETGAATGVRRLPETHGALLRYARKRNPMNHPAVMFRKSAVARAGGYRPMPYFEDYDLWVRMLQSGARLGNCPKVLLRMRAGASLYNRRGGLAYCRAVRNFYRAMRDEGFLSPAACFFHALARCVISLAPGFARRGLYQRALRDTAFGKTE